MGSGGCGKTFLAEDVYTPSKRQCVIKQLKPASDDPFTYQIIQERFQREAAALETLGVQSDQIPALHAYFTEDEEFYLVQDLVEGKSLARKVKDEGVFSEGRVKDLLFSLLPVLEYVHSNGIIHRDIKPENVMLRARDDKPVLIDFGAVKEIVSTVVDADGSPTSSIVIGSPGFMPLEQAAGKPVFSSDLYSLGLTAIFLLTGKRPKELNDLTTGEIVWRKYAADVGPGLAEILDKSIRPLARERYRTAREMLEALSPAEEERPAEEDLKPSRGNLKTAVNDLRPAREDLRPPEAVTDVTVPARRVEPRESGTTLFQLPSEDPPILIPLLGWGLAGAVSGLTSSLTVNVFPKVRYLYGDSGTIELAPGIVFGITLFLLGEFSGSRPGGRRGRLFSLIVMVAASTCGWYLAANCAVVVSGAAASKVVGFLTAGVVGGAFIAAGELSCWRLEPRMWVYAALVVAVAGLSGILVTPLAPGSIDALLLTWQGLVAASHVVGFRVLSSSAQ